MQYVLVLGNIMAFLQKNPLTTKTITCNAGGIRWHLWWNKSSECAQETWVPDSSTNTSRVEGRILNVIPRLWKLTKLKNTKVYLLVYGMTS